MRIRQGPMLLAAAVGTLAALVISPMFGPATPATAAEPGQVERGRYLAMTGACMECHTERAGGANTLKQDALFAGGEAFGLPFGTVWSANITSDKETGIGNATDPQIKRAIREGIGIDGRKLLVMPWENLRVYSDEDLDAMVAFLRTVPPVKRAVTPSDAPLPAREGFYAAASQRARPVGGPQAPGGTQNPERGRYLMTAFGCTDCHGPNLAGGFPPFFAANITNDNAAGLGRWNNEQIVKAVREGVKPDGSVIRPPMPSLTAYRHMNDDDMYNIIAYIRSAPLVSGPAAPPAAAAPAAPPAAPPAMAAPAAPPAMAAPAAPAAAPAALPKTGEPSQAGLLAGLLAAGVLTLGAGLRLRLQLRRIRS
ncbi:MAG: cytochrome c [Chloroflexi bacterium]|nr:cytochrome c [Chloroflexota bacterium]